MVVGYNCTENCGFQRERDIGESGERICPDCGKAVIGITGDLRPRTSEFEVSYGTGGNPYPDGSVRVTAETAEDAFDRAQSEMPNDKDVIDISKVRES